MRIGLNSVSCPGEIRVKYPLYYVDTFSCRVFGGNPAAVVTMDQWLEDATLQAIAAEHNLSETAFVIPHPNECLLRWFTPTLEMDLCGHATLGAAHILFKEHFPNQVKLNFMTRSGKLGVTRNDGLIYLDFPSRPGSPIDVDDALIDALGIKPVDAVLSRDLLVAFGSETDVRKFRPDFARIEALDAFALIVTAPGTDVDFVSRFFAPRAGVPEDPVTGSAHCTLIPYWARRLGKQRLYAKQLSKRGGDLHCELRGDRVCIGGEAVEYLRGEINVETAS